MVKGIRSNFKSSTALVQMCLISLRQELKYSDKCVIDFYSAYVELQVPWPFQFLHLVATVALCCQESEKAKRVMAQAEETARYRSPPAPIARALGVNFLYAGGEQAPYRAANLHAGSIQSAVTSFLTKGRSTKVLPWMGITL